jgi:hypothetical protein
MFGVKVLVLFDAYVCNLHGPLEGKQDSSCQRVIASRGVRLRQLRRIANTLTASCNEVQALCTARHKTCAPRVGSNMGQFYRHKLRFGALGVQLCILQKLLQLRHLQLLQVLLHPCRSQEKFSPLVMMSRSDSDSDSDRSVLAPRPSRVFFDG